MAKNHETELMVKIQDAMAASGKCLVWRNQCGGAHVSGDGFIKFGLGKGSPDLVGIHIPTGRFIGCEVKTPSGQLSPAQKAWHRGATAAGAFVFCARDVDEAIGNLLSLEHQ